MWEEQFCKRGVLLLEGGQRDTVRDRNNRNPLKILSQSVSSKKRENLIERTVGYKVVN